MRATCVSFSTSSETVRASQARACEAKSVWAAHKAWLCLPMCPACMLHVVLGHASFKLAGCVQELQSQPDNRLRISKM